MERFLSIFIPVWVLFIILLNFNGVAAEVFLYGYADGIKYLQQVYTPFNLINIIFTLLTLSPALVAMYYHGKIHPKRIFETTARWYDYKQERSTKGRWLSIFVYLWTQFVILLFVLAACIGNNVDEVLVAENLAEGFDPFDFIIIILGLIPSVYAGMRLGRIHEQERWADIEKAEDARRKNQRDIDK